MRIVFAITIALCLAGCATPAREQSMVVQSTAPAPANPKYRGAITLGDVSGGKETNPLWTAQVGNESFRASLETTLSQMGYLERGTTPRFTLSATLQKLDQPFAGFDMTVTSTVEYRLAGPGTQHVFTIIAAGTATMSDQIIGVERLRVANEFSMRKNFEQLLAKLATLK